MLELREVSCGYRVVEGDAVRQEPVLRGASLSVAPGEVVALVGPNGAGKSTLARVACGSLAASSGDILLDGAPLDADDLVRSVGYVRQDPESQIVAPVVFDEVAFGPCNLGLAEGEVRARVAEALGACGLAGYDERLVSSLSGGELQRVALAGVLAMRPRYLVLDEVTSMLDEGSREQVRAIVADCAMHGVGVLMVTHERVEVAAVTRVALVEEGHVAWCGSPEDFFGDEGLLARAGYDVCDSVRRGSAGRGEAGGGAGAAEVGGEVGRWVGTATAVGGLATGSGLELHDVTVSYGAGAPALDGLTLRCAPGRVTLVCGPSGSGKSTAAHVASGLLAPGRGAALLGGTAVTIGRVGLCLQRAEDQLFCATVLEDVMFGPRNFGVGDAEAHGRAEAALRELGVAEALWERSPFALSGGQRRRVALAGIVATVPEAYVLDEPTVGLDLAGRAFLHEVVRRLADAGHPVMVISHDVAEWLPVADDVAVLRAGRAAWRGGAGAFAADEGAQALARAAYGSGEPTGTGDREPARTAAAAAPVAGDALLGSYVPGDTPLHRLDVRVKLALLLAATVALFAASSPWALAAMAVAVLCLARAGGVSARTLASGLKPTALILAFSLVANALVLDGTGDVALVGMVGVSLAGLARGAMAVARIAVLVGAALLVTTVTSSTAVADALASLMGPLARVGVPTGDLAMTISVALRFIPLTAEELERIRDAQRARGVDFGAGGVVVRVSRWLSVLTPLVVALLRRANDLAAAMRERCYRGEGRTRLARPLRRIDLIVLVAGLVACALLCLI